MASPVAPPGFQGDLVDPNTGQRLFRIEQRWEQHVAAPPTGPAPVPVPPVPTAADVPSQQPVRWIWTAHGYYPFSV